MPDCPGGERGQRPSAVRAADAFRPLRHRPEISAPVVALTFDDGPSEWTGAMLDHLAAHAGRGTFFVVGEAIDGDAREAALRRTAREGELGNHTFRHPPELSALALDELREELRLTNERVESAVGVVPRLWRAPHFRSDLRSRTIAAGLGLREVGASVIPADYQWEAERTAEFVLRDLRPGDIVDLHDGRPRLERADASSESRDDTVLALKLILEEMTVRGLRSVTISELLDAE